MSKETFSQTFSFGGATIEYRSFELADVKLTFDERKLTEGAVRVQGVVIGTETLGYSSRFGISFATLLKQSPSIFSLFDVSEVIARALARKIVSGQAVVTIDRTNPSVPVALAVAPFTKKFFTLSHLQSYFEHLKEGATVAAYAGDGVFTIDYDLSIIHRPVEVHGLALHPTLTMRVSIDGWGRPVAWLASRVGKNGPKLLAMADAFRTSANIGEESGKYVSALSRFTRSFSNEEGFGALHARLGASHLASASLAEFMDFERAVNKSKLSERAYKQVALFAHEEALRFGLTSLSVVSKKRTVRVPSRMAVSDLIFMAVELAHKEATGDVTPLFEWIGSVLAEEGGFDLEGSLDVPSRPKETYISEAASAAALPGIAGDASDADDPDTTL